jgi:protein-S-isoprenylcysteine O-methyltransferase Ste14
LSLQEKIASQGNWLVRYKSILPFLILYASVYFNLEHALQAGNTFSENFPYKKMYEILCLAILIFGELIRIITIGFTSGDNSEITLTDSSGPTGIYSIVRHPIYIGDFFIWLGIVMLTFNFWFIITYIFLYALCYERVMFAEEQLLQKRFGERYLLWVNKTPAIIPAFNNFIKPHIQFCWRKIFKLETFRLTGLGLIFFILIYSSQAVKQSIGFSHFILFTCILSLTAYIFIVRFIGFRSRS